MKTVLEIKEKSKNHFYFEGNVSYTKIKTESVDIDGNLYHRQVSEDIQKSVGELEPYYFTTKEFNFPIINTNVIVDDYYGFDKNTLSYFSSKYNYSTNEDVQLIRTLFEKGLLDKRIKDVFTSKQDYCFNLHSPNSFHNKELIKQIYDDGEVYFYLFGYGFNNSVYFSISLQDLIQIPYDNFDKKLLNLFIKEGILDKKGDVNKSAISIFETKARIRKQKTKQY